ncbi:SUKH-3 domain-containing protein [Amycolatopsis sp. Poz14]|uniref:SUKH-3 domain-containing protein n=1 Tax=Amycolatopsis sp. Poz14 TaxID=1447705 RepID=UPI001EE805AF|nr:SUKH-3 domain-containing protein [Amycolatopsis sp. Poz14]MCG3751104.1 SUKH-3 domain-containing protein [Amycolatopsis sp. Poz14]
MNERPSIKLLRKAGWTPGRDVDNSEDLRSLAEAGLEVFPAAASFLREYSGISMQWKRSSGFPDEMRFSAARVLESFDPRWVASYADRAKTALVPVGEASNGYLVLLLGRNGHWFGGFDDAFGELGGDVLTCIDRLVAENKFMREL